MAKNIELVRQEVAAMRNEAEDFANSAERVGGVVSDILEYSHAESERAKGAEQGLTAAVAKNAEDIEAEKQRAIAAEGEIRGSVESLGEDLNAASEDISKLEVALEAEKSRAKAAEQALSTEITEAENRVDERVTEVRDDLEAEVQARSEAVAGLGTDLKKVKDVQIEKITLNVKAYKDVDIYLPKGWYILETNSAECYLNYGIENSQYKNHSIQFYPYKLTEDVYKVRCDITGELVITISSGSVVDINSRIEDLSDEVNLLNDCYVIEGVLGTDGSYVNQNAVYSSTDYIEIPEGTYKIEAVASINNQYKVAGFFVFDEEKRLIDKIQGLEPYSPSNVKIVKYYLKGNEKYVRCSAGNNMGAELFIKMFRNQALEDIEKLKNSVESLEENVEKSKKYNKNGFSAKKEILYSGDSIEIPNTPNLKTAHSLSFSCNLNSFGRIKITHGEQQYNLGRIEIDSTNIYVYYRNNDLKETIEHGLNISSNLSVTITVRNVGKATVAITSKGYSVTKDITWNGCKDNAKVTSISGEYSDCILTIGGYGLSKDVWVFGDSYLDYWAALAASMEANNYLLDGYSGRGSSAALTSLKRNLEVYTPKIIVWMLGMNNQDVGGVVNVSYKETMEELLDICKKNSIYLYISTIPNTDARNHTYKNEYVRSLLSESVEVIDLAALLGANAYPSTWYDGLYGNDGAHPSPEGAKQIAAVLVSYVPEMINEMI